MADRAPDREQQWMETLLALSDLLNSGPLTPPDVRETLDLVARRYAMDHSAHSGPHAGAV